MKESKYQDLKNRCKLFYSNESVFGEGNLDATIVLVGEAPGAEEVKLGKPFVGKAGKNLDSFLERIELNRSDLYVTNVVKVRPWEISDKGNKVNRPPTDKEVELYGPLLNEEVKLIAPKIVVTLGGVALKAITNDKRASITKEHGKPISNKDFLIFPLYHPASIIYDQDKEAAYYEDLVKLKQFIEEHLNGGKS